MARIPRYTPERSITPRGSAAPIDVRALEEPGSALAGLGAAAAGAGQGALDRLRQAEDTAWTTEATGEAQRHWTKRLGDAQRGAGEDPVGFTPRVMEEYDGWRTGVLDRAPSRQARADTAARLESLKTSLFEDAVTFETKAGRMKRLATTDASLSALETAAFEAPHRLPELLTQASGDLDAAAATWMLPEDATTRRAASRQALAEAAWRGRALREPERALGVLEGTIEDATVDGIPVDRRAALAAGARAELSRRRVEGAAIKRELADELKEIADITGAGFNPGGDRLATLSRRVAATGDPELATDLANAKADATFAAQLRLLTPPDLQQVVNDQRAALTARGSVTAGEANRAELAEKMLAKMNTELDRDPLSWANRVGLVKTQPITLVGAAAEGSMRQRAAVALQVGAHYGVPARFLTDEEETQLKASIAAGNPDSQLSLAYSIGRGFGSHAPDVLRRIAGDEPVFAHAAGLATMGSGQATAARDALRGHAAIKAGNSVLPLGADRNDWTADELGDALGMLPGTRAAVLQAAAGIYTARAMARGVAPTSSDAEDLWRASLRAATGEAASSRGAALGGLGEHAGRKFVVPSSMAPSVAEKLLAAITDADLVADPRRDAPPTHGDGSAFTAAHLADARLVDYGPGQYLVDVAGDGTEFVRGSGPDGYFVLDLTALAPRLLGRIGKPKPGAAR